MLQEAFTTNSRCAWLMYFQLSIGTQMLSNAQGSINLLLTAELGAYSGDEEALTVSADFAYSLDDSQRPVGKFGTVLPRLTNGCVQRQLDI